jgi:transcriptional regulator with XRE-family HTH domain
MRQAGRVTARDFKRLGEAVSDRRAELGISQEEFVRNVNMSVKTLQRIEAGREVRVQTLGELNRAAKWKAGSAQAVLAGGTPEPREQVVTHPAPERPSREEQLRELMAMAAALREQANEFEDRLNALSQEGDEHRAG